MRFTPTVRALAGLLFVAGLVGCSSGEGVGIIPATGSADNGPLIGVSMPTVTSERWVNDGENIKASLAKLGYRVDLQYAQNDVQAQVHQLEYQITKDVKLLIIASIDGGGIQQQMQEAEAKKIPVIAYDRLIRNSTAVDYYASFDNYKVGVAQATSLLTGLGLTKNGATGGPLNIEIFAGSPDDNNATFFFKGAMDTLKPYLDDGRLVVRSGQTDFKSVSTLRWDPVPAQKRMEDLLTKTYRGGVKVQGVLSPYDGMSIGILSALKSNGYGTADQPYPVVTGQDAELASVKSIIASEQYSTIFKDTRQLAEVTVKMADEILKGRTPPTNNTTDYDNGKKVVSSYLLQPVIVTKANYKKVLFDSGYYSLDDLK
ncbi:MAG: putative multiple sugar transport system substrate-binding protein [Actinomycetota bacterium]|nr:putative multiple sugar transport system substrate-binding protein [Actinomycetota bacterium]